MGRAQVKDQKHIRKESWRNEKVTKISKIVFLFLVTRRNIEMKKKQLIMNPMIILDLNLKKIVIFELIWTQAISHVHIMHFIIALLWLFTQLNFVYISFYIIIIVNTQGKWHKVKSITLNTLSNVANQKLKLYLQCTKLQNFVRVFQMSCNSNWCELLPSKQVEKALFSYHEMYLNNRCCKIWTIRWTRQRTKKCYLQNRNKKMSTYLKI